MEHLDLAGMITSSHNWCLPTFEQQDAIYLSNSRQMLEPILEETSEEDEEHSHGSWSQYDHHYGFYSSAESETGSVIRVENNKDADAISERDFACPAKRARHAQEFPSNALQQLQSVDDNVILRQHHYSKNGSADNIFVESITRDSSSSSSNNNNRDLTMQSQSMQRNSTGNKRFDEFFSDSDSLSFNSLSRSSSLIQFESLERALLLQDQHVSSNSLGASSPSLLSFDGGGGSSGCGGNNKQTTNSNEECARSGGNSGNSSRRGSQISLLRRFESSDGRLHQTYCQLDKLNFEDEIDHTQPTQFLPKPDTTVEGGRGNKRSIAKNSAENLSEDSGYCEPSPSIMLQRGIQQKFEKFSEEEEEYNAFIDDEQQLNENLCNSVENENAMPPQPKINNERENMLFVCCIKNSSPTRERTYERSFTHSPSPSSSIGSDASSHSHSHSSSSSRSTCDHSIRSSKSCSIDSTASFNWLPIVKDVPTQERATRETHSLRALNENFRNSLPDISNVNCQENFEAQYLNSLEYFSIHTKIPTTTTTVEDTPDFLEVVARGRSEIENDPDSKVKRTLSLPNDLHKLEKSILMKRSSSWSTINKITTRESDSKERVKEKSVGYLNASYHNLTLLDYSGKMNANNLKRNSNMERSDADERVSADYESIICKGNFLLDELSQIYDRNASILNNRTVDALLEEAEQKIALYEESLASQRPRLKNRNSLDLPDYEAEEVQHVQLTIRKPPERRRKNKTNSLIETENYSDTGCRTFDQDPTNLRTSYAQSLEKCNFDAKEVSSTSTDVRNAQRSLPKRRFHSHAVHAKKKNLVSSTPNLNSFECVGDDGDLEDDIYVSSAHTSMHQLPQGSGAKAQKPLGILLPAGSRSSFGKEVSFCPVVSKYCWHEQSSEECNAAELQRQNGVDLPTEEEEEEGDANKIEETANKSDDEEESEEEELDDDVIFNTKENETIAVRDQLREREEIRELLPKETTEIVNKRTFIQNEVIPIAAFAFAVDNSKNIPELSLKPTIASVEHEITNKADSDSACECKEKQQILTSTSNIRESKKTFEIENNGSRNATTRPLSMQLPILSEPPINRAHHILYASQQLLDKRTTRELIDDLERTHNNNKSTSFHINTTMSSSTTGQNKFNINNNNNNNISNNSSSSGNKSQKIKPDEKHPRSMGFLSRFANGLRFSLRRNKKKQQQQQSDIEQTPTTTTIKNGPLPYSSSGSGSSNYNNNGSSNVDSSKIGAKLATTTKIVTGKPPLPKQPPRILQQQQQQQRIIKNLILDDSAGATHAQSPAAAAANYNNEMQFLEVERSYYNNNYGAADDTSSSAEYTAFRNQLMAGVQTVNGTPTATNNNNNKLTTTNEDDILSFTSPSRATVAQKTQIFQNLANKQQQQKQPHHQSNGRLVNSIVVRSQKQSQHNSNASAANNTTTIGLIETNLDTHETIISGKTRSLLDIAADRKNVASKQRRTTLVTTNVLENDVDNSDNEVDGNGDGVIIKKSTNSQGNKTQIASVRRPHKSMEFLLDKENQKNVLPPENELQKSHENNPAMLSEHQLRIQASLQRLNIPDWFRQYNQKSPETANGSVNTPYKPGNFTRKRTTESGRWAGLNSKTTSLSSLGSQRSDRSPLLLSPSAHSHHGGQSANAQATHASSGSHNVASAGYTPGHSSFSRWSTSHLSSSQTSPIASQRGSFARGNAVNSSFMSVASGNSGVIRNSFRQPYMGWRSQEKLSQRTAHERLASSLLAQQQQQQQQQLPTTQEGNKNQAITPEIQSSIKEVTSAIVHYVNDQTNPQRSRSTSPNSR